MNTNLKPAAAVLTVLTAYALIVPLVSGIEDPNIREVFRGRTYRLVVGSVATLAGLFWWLWWQATPRGGAR